MKLKTNDKKSILIILMIMFIVVIIVTCIYQQNTTLKKFLDTYVFRKKIYQDDLTYIATDNINETNIYAYNDNIVILRDNQLNIYNKYGNIEKTIEVKINQPIFQSKNNILCIAEKGGQNVYVINGKNILWEKKVDGKIANVNVNKNGYVAVSIIGTSYKTIVEMYNDVGEEMFKTFLSTSSVIDTTISSDNKYLAIAEINYAGTAIQSNVKVIAINEAQKNSTKSILGEYKAPLGDLIITVNYNNKNDLVCMYDNYIEYLDKDMNNINITNLSSEETLFAGINLPTTVIKVLKKNSGVFQNEAELKIINETTQKEISYPIEDIPKALIVYENNICLNLGSTALFINDNGWLIKEYLANQEIQNVVIGGNIAGIIYNNKIEIINL